MNHYPDLPDTTVYFRPLSVSAPAVSFASCGCALPASCPRCDGTAAEEREGDDGWAAICAVRDAWRSGQLTARDYYHRSCAVSFDALPSLDAAAALGRAEQAETQGSAA